MFPHTYSKLRKSSKVKDFRNFGKSQLQYYQTVNTVLSKLRKL